MPLRSRQQACLPSGLIRLHGLRSPFRHVRHKLIDGSWASRPKGWHIKYIAIQMLSAVVPEVAIHRQPTMLKIGALAHSICAIAVVDLCIAIWDVPTHKMIRGIAY